MPFLLDTHVLLWWLSDSLRLSEQAKNCIQSETNVIYVSAASLWEIRIKESLGKISIPHNFIDILSQQAFLPLAMKWTHAEQFSSLPLHHRDPFDRILIAQSMVEKLPLISSDVMMKNYPIETVW